MTSHDANTDAHFIQFGKYVDENNNIVNHNGLWRTRKSILQKDFDLVKCRQPACYDKGYSWVESSRKFMEEHNLEQKYTAKLKLPYLKQVDLHDLGKAMSRDIEKTDFLHRYPEPDEKEKTNKRTEEEIEKYEQDAMHVMETPQCIWKSSDYLKLLKWKMSKGGHSKFKTLQERKDQWEKLNQNNYTTLNRNKKEDELEISNSAENFIVENMVIEAINKGNEESQIEQDAKRILLSPQTSWKSKDFKTLITWKMPAGGYSMFKSLTERKKQWEKLNNETKQEQENEQEKSETNNEIEKIYIQEPIAIHAHSEVRSMDNTSEIIKEPPLLNIDQFRTANNILYSRNDMTITVHKFKITREYIERFKPKRWYNDEIINAHNHLINERNKRDIKDGCTEDIIYCFNTAFFTNLFFQSGYNYIHVKNWGKKNVPGQDIFKIGQILIPIINNGHWTCAVVYTKEQKIQYYDSKGIYAGQEYLVEILKYLADEYFTNTKEQLKINKWNLIKCQPSTPQQSNDDDCGVHTCLNINYISQGLEVNYSEAAVDRYRNNMLYSMIKGRINNFA